MHLHQLIEIMARIKPTEDRAAFLKAIDERNVYVYTFELESEFDTCIGFFYTQEHVNLMSAHHALAKLYPNHLGYVADSLGNEIARKVVFLDCDDEQTEQQAIEQTPLLQPNHYAQ